MNTENIEDIYELSPIQKGILFHSLYAPELGLYFFQMPFILRGQLNLEAFVLAWQQLAARHTVLRTSFYWEDINKPLQVVHRQVTVPLEQQDWRELDSTEQEKRLKSFLERDRALGFDLAQAPLMRLTLIRLSDKSYQLVWSRHFLIIDGWSVPLLLAEVIQLYEALCQSRDASLLPSIPYRNYIDWLQQQDLAQAEAFWRQTLKGLKVPTPLTHLDIDSDIDALSNQAGRYEEQQIYLPAAIAAALHSLSRQHKLTLSTLFQGVWAILLSRYSCENEVVYGCTVAGRPIELVREEPIVGLFVNSLPVWVKVEPEQSFLAWLKQLQAHLVEMRQYEWTPLVEIQGWSEVPRNLPLFESILVYENAPVDATLESWKGSIEISNSTIFSNSSTFYKTNYPLTIAVYPDPGFRIAINYDFRRFDIDTINSILTDFNILLQEIVEHPHTLLQDLLLLTVSDRQLVSTLETAATFDFEFAN